MYVDIIKIYIIMNVRILIICISFLFGQICQAQNENEVGDRQYWTDLLYKISAPVLSNMSKGELKKKMTVELSPQWLKGRDPNLTYMEAFCRLMSGLAPWLSLPDDSTPEGLQRRQLREWALQSYANAVDPESPDYLVWEGEGQVLCDASYIANSFLRAPKTLWEPLDEVTKQRYITTFQNLNWVRPAYNNWLLFRLMVETFLLSIGEDYDAFAMEISLQKMNEWYLGDGWYADGPEFSLDYYNSFVINPYLVEVMDVLKDTKVHKPVSFDLVFRRMQRYNVLLERLISPEGTIPVVGRSMTYRLGAFQPLGLAAWKYKLPEKLTNGQVRNALTTAMKRMFSQEGNFGEAGFLQLGFCGHQSDLADYYTNNGSAYITSLGFLPLGLPADHPFWTDLAEDWTSRKAWNGEFVPRDYHESIKR